MGRKIDSTQMMNRVDSNDESSRLKQFNELIRWEYAPDNLSAIFTYIQ